MPSLQDLILSNLTDLRQARNASNTEAVTCITATLNRRLALLTGNGQAR